MICINLLIFVSKLFHGYSEWTLYFEIGHLFHLAIKCPDDFFQIMKSWYISNQVINIYIDQSPCTVINQV